MAHISVPRPKKSVIKPAVNGIKEQQVQNKILLALPKRERAVLFSKLKFVSLPIRTVLNQIGKHIDFGYFMNDGLASVLSIMGDGKSVEVGLCGREGFVGLPLVAGFSSSPTHIIVQV